jgi:hypothetical protein
VTGSPNERIKMNLQTLGLRVAGTVFGVVSAVHLLRLVTRADVVIAGWPMPLWMNVAGCVITAGLCAWLWRLAARAPKR